MYPHETLLEFHNEARSIKEHIWYEHHEPDMYPMLSVRWRDTPAFGVDVKMVGTMVETMRAFAIEKAPNSWVTKIEMSTPLVLWACLGALSDGVPLPGIDDPPPKGTPMESIWLACEGYSLELEGEALEAYHQEYARGDLQTDYETNPASKVLERLTTYQVETASTGLAEWGRVTSAFHKDDGGRIVWHEPLITTSEDYDAEQDGWDKLLEIMIPHVTREKLA